MGTYSYMRVNWTLTWSQCDWRRENPPNAWFAKGGEHWFQRERLKQLLDLHPVGIKGVECSPLQGLPSDRPLFKTFSSSGITYLLWICTGSALDLHWIFISGFHVSYELEFVTELYSVQLKK